MATPLIENTVMHRGYDENGVQKRFKIQAVEGYVLHDNRIDRTDDYDNVIPRFKFGDTTVVASYDFDTVTNGTFAYTDENGMEVTIPVEMIGMYEFYTLSADIVPEDQTCGNDNDHEVM